MNMKPYCHAVKGQGGAEIGRELIDAQMGGRNGLPVLACAVHMIHCN